MNSLQIYVTSILLQKSTKQITRKDNKKYVNGTRKNEVSQLKSLKIIYFNRSNNFIIQLELYINKFHLNLNTLFLSKKYGSIPKEKTFDGSMESISVRLTDIINSRILMMFCFYLLK
jgi:hypothetical protein